MCPVCPEEEGKEKEKRRREKRWSGNGDPRRVSSIHYRSPSLSPLSLSLLLLCESFNISLLLRRNELVDVGFVGLCVAGSLGSVLQAAAKRVCEGSREDEPTD